MPKLQHFIASLAIILFAVSSAPGQSGLQITYGSQGIQQLSYQGVTLENLAQTPSDAFHIWHMKMTDLSGNPATCAQCGWGENNNGRAWNAGTDTWTYTFSWGSISVRFQQVGDSLNMNVTETNLPNSGYILDGATIYPFVLNFPQLPAGFLNATYPQLAYETTAPGVTTADWGSGEVVAVDPNASKPLYSGFLPTGNGSSYTPLISGTTPDGLAAFLPHNDRPVQPGQTETFTVSLRFAPSGTAVASLASDAYQNWAQTWPPQLNWTDRRVIGTLYLASSPQGNVNQPGGYPNNPRRYFNDSNPNDFDVTTTAGIAKFQGIVLKQAASDVVNLQNLNAQGAITWDLEGEQYPQPTSYVCSPDQIAVVAPEMETVITDATSPYVGMKLDDAYFKIITSAGFRVGVCIRPQQFAINADGTAQQTYLPDSAIPALLISKMKYAHDRWGATLFYVDSTVESSGAILDAGIFQQVAAALPDSLIMPEESTPKDYAYTAPFLSFLFHGDLGTDPSVYNYYPHAFSANLVNDVAAATLAASQAQLTASVRNGDLLMAHADYWQANNPTIVQIYKDAGVTQTPTTPVTTDPPVTTPTNPPTTSAVSITSPSLNATIAGVIAVTAQVGVNLDAAGSYLMVDGAEIGTSRVDGAPYNYPLDTTLLANGTHTLQIWAHDTSNAVDLSSTVTVTVTNQSAGTSPPTTPTAPTPTPVSTSYPITLNYPQTGQAISGVAAVTALISQPLDPAGSYLMVDGIEVGWNRVDGPPYVYPLDTSSLSSGQHTLQVWAHDIANETLLSNPVIVTTTGQ